MSYAMFGVICISWRHSDYQCPEMSDSGLHVTVSVFWFMVAAGSIFVLASIQYYTKISVCRVDNNVHDQTQVS